MKYIQPTYNHCLVQAGNSIRRFCQLALHHDSLVSVDQWLENEQIEQLLVVLIDGMGYNQTMRYLDPAGFIRTYTRDCIQSVYPSTTVAATTALRTGLLPCESGWLGWHQYIPKVDDSVIMFQERSYYGHCEYPGLIKNSFPIQYSAEEAGRDALELFPWTNVDCTTLDGLLEQANKELNAKRRYVYAYWDGYDSHMHAYGVVAPSSVAMLRKIETSLSHLADKLDDHVGLMILADHGHIDIEERSLLDYPELTRLLRFPPTLETRAVNFYVKEGCIEAFQTIFEQNFQHQFQLYSHAEVCALGLFGEAGKKPCGEAAIGDFVACAIDHQILTYGDAFAGTIKGNHAGMSDDEMLIPVILYTK